MTFRDLLERWGLTELKVTTSFLEATFEPQDYDKDAAWDLYIELITRITTQELPEEAGVEEAALQSVYSIFSITRNTLKEHGRKAKGFSKIAIIVLNQIIRPFTAKWHRLKEEGAFKISARRQEFREELKELQIKLRQYTKLLAELADVEDMTDIELEE